MREKIALVRYFHGYRGGKGLEAEKRGAAGVIVYSDPAEDGASQGKTYPDGPWGPAGHFQRGAVVYDFLVPGDPLTPGWPSTDSARRLSEAESKILPKIPMVPLSAADAKEILSRLGGPQAPKEWQGGLPIANVTSTEAHSLAVDSDGSIVVGGGTELCLRVAIFEFKGDGPVAHHVQEVLKVSRVEADLDLFAGVVGCDGLARLALLGCLRADVQAAGREVETDGV